MAEQTMVVGFDGSPDAEAAVRWAAHEAIARGARLQLVHAYDFPYLHELDPSAQRDLRDRAQRIAMHGAGIAAAAGVTVEALAVEGDAAGALVEAAADAVLLVVGRRGERHAFHWLLGSVAAKCVHHAACNVAVVPAA